MRFQNLDDWLRWQETLHPTSIELGLERVRQVFHQLHPESPPFTIITVAGTNGKGSSVALLESIFNTAGYKVGTYTSPHLLRYNERIRLSGDAASDAQICQAFQRVDEARGDVSLTYFEFGTLAALDLFYQYSLDVVLLEVGLGGRLDAVNIIDSDVALITAIGLDHTDWLGEDRESIAREKAGIMRVGKPVVCSDGDIPKSIFSEAKQIGSQLYCLGKDFKYEHANGHWSWIGPNGDQHNFPLPALRGEHQLRNATGVMMVLECLAASLPVSFEHVQQALEHVQVTGRQQVIRDKTNWLVDVAHNVQSIEALADCLKMEHADGRTHAVVGMLKDKDIAANLQIIQPLVTDWYCVGLPVPRGASAVELQEVLARLSVKGNIYTCDDVSKAMENAQSRAAEGDRFIVFGSFYTVAEALQRSV